MATSHLYTDLSIYYDRFCQDIPYAHQANTLKRLEALFNESCGQHYLDIACGTGQLMEQAQKFGWQMSGLDNAQAMLTRASSRCPEASWILADMVQIPAKPQYNFASCLLYSMHYTGSLKRLRGLFQAVWQALVPGGFWVFDCVDKRGIDNSAGITTYYRDGDEQFTFFSRWDYPGAGSRQSLKLGIELKTPQQNLAWQDEHPMVAVSIHEVETLLAGMGFKVTLLERNFEQLIAWQGASFNFLVVAQKPLCAEEMS